MLESVQSSSEAIKTSAAVMAHLHVRHKLMKPYLFGILAICLGLSLGGGGCSKQASVLPLSLEAVSQMSAADTMKISFEEKKDGLFVSVTDKHGDSHIHKLDIGLTTKQRALEILVQKQAELEKRL